jgi:hypothetical protein
VVAGVVGVLTVTVVGEAVAAAIGEMSEGGDECVGDCDCCVVAVAVDLDLRRLGPPLEELAPEVAVGLVEYGSNRLERFVSAPSEEERGAEGCGSGMSPVSMSSASPL